ALGPLELFGEGSFQGLIGLDARFHDGCQACPGEAFRHRHVDESRCRRLLAYLCELMLVGGKLLLPTVSGPHRAKEEMVATKEPDQWVDCARAMADADIFQQSHDTDAAGAVPQQASIPGREVPQLMGNDPGQSFLGQSFL